MGCLILGFSSHMSLLAAAAAQTFRNGFFNHTSSAVIMKSMPVFQGSIRNVTYENLRLHNVRTGVCVNTAAQVHSRTHRPTS